MRIRFRYQLRRSSSLFTVTTRIVFTVFILARFTTPGLTSTNLVFLSHCTVLYTCIRVRIALFVYVALLPLILSHPCRTEKANPTLSPENVRFAGCPFELRSEGHPNREMTRRIGNENPGLGIRFGLRD
jgi:hypothetical protein